MSGLNLVFSTVPVAAGGAAASPADGAPVAQEREEEEAEPRMVHSLSTAKDLSTGAFQVRV